MYPAEFVHCREAITGGTGGKHTYGLFVPGMLLALDFCDFPTAEIAVSFKHAQEVACLDRNMLPDIANENSPHVVFLSQAQQFFPLTVRLQAGLIANDHRTTQIKLGGTVLQKIGHRGCHFEPFRL